MMIFKDRTEAGKQLSQTLSSYCNKPNTVVLGLARGGIVVAYEIAKELSLPLNVLIPRKIGAPGNPELAIGAIAEDGALWRNESLIELIHTSSAEIEHAITQAKAMIDERSNNYRKIVPKDILNGKTAILVDDGIATGATMLAEILSLRKQGVKKIVAAAPVASARAWAEIEKVCDQAFCLQISETLIGISEFYADFSQVEDETVLSLLKLSKKLFAE